MQEISRRDETEETTWLQNCDCAELKEIIYQHMTHENMLTCAKIMKEELKLEMDPRDFTQFFIHHFTERYQGAKDIVGFVKSLITYMGIYPCFKELVPKLEWLKAKINLRRKGLFLCEEDEMNRFPGYISTELSRQDFSQLNQYPDIKSKLMHLIGLILHNPKYYQILQTYCQNRGALRKYVFDDVHVNAHGMIYVSIFVCTIPTYLYLTILKYKSS